VRRLGCVVLAVLAVVAAAPAAEASGGYSRPVDGPIIDRFRPPPTPYGPGNRGIDFATAPGEDARAAADGEVVFAGRVGRTLHVVVLHPDGIRTSYSFLAQLAVRRGQHVARGQVVGRTGTSLHFGARVGDDHYLDPERLLEGEPPEVHLIPVEERRRQSLFREAWNVARSLGAAAVGVSAEGVAWARQEVDDLVTAIEVAAHYADVVGNVVESVRRGVEIWWDQRDCTPASTPPPRAPGRGRIAVLVAGLGSTSTRSSLQGLRTGALGYPAERVATFSYRGGQVDRDGPELAGVRTSTYRGAGTEGDLRASADHLRELLRDVGRAHPGVPVDVIAHSQGGVVARLALAGDDARRPRVANLVTLATPHRGSRLATINAGVGTSTTGEAVQAVASLTGVNPHATAVAQLATSSSFVRELERTPLPEGVRVTSIAARGDLVVPALDSTLAGRPVNALVGLEGPSAHRDLPASPEAGREVALALAGRGPTCRRLWGDLGTAASVAAGEYVAGAAAFVGGQVVDRRLPGPHRSPRSPGPVRAG
jgi:hypothetical protein